MREHGALDPAKVPAQVQAARTTVRVGTRIRAPLSFGMRLTVPFPGHGAAECPSSGYWRVASVLAVMHVATVAFLRWKER